MKRRRQEKRERRGGGRVKGPPAGDGISRRDEGAVNVINLRVHGWPEFKVAMSFTFAWEALGGMQCEGRHAHPQISERIQIFNKKKDKY